jgi:hypothetical protein
VVEEVAAEMDSDYSPVGPFDDEDELLRNGGYAPVAPSPSDTAPGAAPAVASPSPMPSIGRSVPASIPGSVDDMEAHAPQPQYAPVGSPNAAAESPRPSWSQYEPPQPHGWAALGHGLAAINPITNRIFNQMPEERAERDYKHATEEYAAPTAQRDVESQTEQREATADKDRATADAMREKPGVTWKSVPGMVGPNGTVLQESTDGTMRWAPGITGAGPVKESSAAGPLSADQATQRNAIWNPILAKNHLPADPFKEGMTDKDASEVATQLNNATGKTQAGVKIDLGEDKGSKSETIKARQEIAKIYADPMSSAERYNVMTQSLHDALANHDQQAMLNLLTNHIGMTMGLQKGARITQAILEEAQKSQPWIATVKAKFDKDGYLSGVTLGPDQMKSMVNLARGRFSQDVVKARSLGKYAGAEDDGPDRVPSKDTMHYYLEVSGNDVAKAKQAAAADGWTVK